MAESNIDGGDSSSFERMVVLEDWWLIKCSNEFDGKRFGVAGTEKSTSVEHRRRAMRGVFISSPIIKAFDVFTLQASDGTYINLRGFLNKDRVVQSGFSPKISRDIVFGFPPYWEQLCNDCFQEAPSINDEACRPFLSPCKNTKGNLDDDSRAEISDKRTVTKIHAAEINGEDGGSDKQTPRKKSLRLQSKSGGKIGEDRRKLELHKVQNTINDSDHGSEGLDKAKSSDIETNGCEAINSEVISQADGGRKHTGADNIGKVTSTSATEELLTSKQGKGEPKVTETSPHSLFKDSDRSSKPVKGISKKSGKTLKSNSSVVEPVNHCGDHNNEGLDNAKKNDVEKDDRVPISTAVISPVDGRGKRHSATDSVEELTSKNDTKESLTLEQRKGKLKKVTKTSLHSLSKDISNSSKPGKKGEPKKSRKTLKSDWNVVEPMNHSESRVKEAEKSLSWGKTKRKIDFDVEVTPVKEANKQKTIVVSTDSLGQKRSRSGRVLVAPLEFWRNQIPVYDMNRNLTQVKEGHEPDSTPSRGKRTRPSKAKKVKTK